MPTEFYPESIRASPTRVTRVPTATPIPVIRRTEKRMLAMAAARGVFKRTDQVCFLLHVALTIAAGNCLVAY
jgi:hypothetical protein